MAPSNTQRASLHQEGCSCCLDWPVRLLETFEDEAVFLLSMSLTAMLETEAN